MTTSLGASICLGSGPKKKEKKKKRHYFKHGEIVLGTGDIWTNKAQLVLKSLPLIGGKK